MANHVAPWEDEEGPTATAQMDIIFQKCCVAFPDTLGIHSVQSMKPRSCWNMKSRCIKFTLICNLTRTEPIFCKNPLPHSETPTRQQHSKPLPSCVKGTQENWILLQLHTCQSITRQMDIGEFGINEC